MARHSKWRPEGRRYVSDAEIQSGGVEAAFRRPRQGIQNGGLKAAATGPPGRRRYGLRLRLRVEAELLHLVAKRVAGDIEEFRGMRLIPAGLSQG